MLEDRTAAVAAARSGCPLRVVVGAADDRLVLAAAAAAAARVLPRGGVELRVMLKRAFRALVLAARLDYARTLLLVLRQALLPRAPRAHARRAEIDAQHMASRV